ncbi:MAG: YceD family protein [Hyalangium sp.]|uniref:YceD family protein n=1 Tax=Hyalangium sp. TaxID=2028555 RepID=UPI00389B12C0
MVVKIEQIQETGLKLDEPIALELLQEVLGGSGQNTGFRATRPSTLHASLRKVSGGVLVQGNFTAHVAAPCKRCLVDVTLDVPVSFTLNLVPESLLRGDDTEDGEAEDREQGETAGSFELEDADEEVFNGKTIDLDPIVREQVLLALPMNAVCREDCKGLCAQCGQNLNEKQCGCEQKVIDPRLAPLMNIKLN